MVQINRTRCATHIIPRLAGLLGHPKKRTTGRWRERDAFHDIIQGVRVREDAVGTSRQRRSTRYSSD
eukprot:scaffold7199_cov133-Skeletonema_marinoi.AAC.5